MLAMRDKPEGRHSSDPSPMLPTPPHSRSGSLSSTTSAKKEPGWMTSLNNVDRSRASSTTSIELPSSHRKSSLKGFFGKHKGEQGKDQKDIDKIVMTSKHTAMVKTKLALAPKSHPTQAKPPGIVGTQNLHNLSAADQEMRHPHSGPPALRVMADKMDMPVLTRINSGDERDEEDEMERARHAWIQSKVPDIEMSKLEENEGVEDDIVEGEMVNASIIERAGTRLIGADLTKPAPHRQKVPIGGRWKRDEKGKWTR